MLTCKQLTELVTDYLEGRLSFGERLALHVHLGMCGHCRAYLRQMRVTVKALGRLPDEPMPTNVRDDLMARFRAMRPRGEVSRAVSISVRLLATIEKAIGGRRGWLAAGIGLMVALALSLGLGLHEGSSGEGAHCLLMEFVASLIPAVLLGLMAFTNKTRLSTGSLVSVATAGGLVAFALLQATCPASHVAAHVVLFHLGGMAVAALASATAARLPVLR